MRIKTLSFIFLVNFWVILTGIPNNLSSILFLLLIPFVTILFALKFSLIPDKFSLKLNAFNYFLWLVKEIIFSTINVIKITWRRNLKIYPIMRPLQSIQTCNLGMVIYANSITLTPGTVTLSIHDNNIMIHALDVSLLEDLEKGVMDLMVKEIVK